MGVRARKRLVRVTQPATRVRPSCSATSPARGKQPYLILAKVRLQPSYIEKDVTRQSRQHPFQISPR